MEFLFHTDYFIFLIYKPGENLSIDSVSLILAGAQTFSWMIPVVLSALGIGLFVFRRSENS